VSSPAVAPQQRPHRAARIEDVLRQILVRALQRRGWTPHVLAYPGYGTDGWVRVLGRVVLSPPGRSRREAADARGWRRFFSAPLAGADVEVAIGGRVTTVLSERGGYFDAVIDAPLGTTTPPAGRAQAQLRIGASTSTADLFVVPATAGTGLISDIDDTVVVTWLPRPLLAFWNTFVRHESARRPVPGMARLYQEIVQRAPDTFVVYLSTGAWNVAPAMAEFLTRHGFPPGPLLLTDWGPTTTGWFRSGAEHKRTQLRRLMAELPRLRWLLVGDDGQRDPMLYQEAAQAAPQRVRAVVLRQLTPSQQVLAHGTPAPRPESDPPHRPGPASVPLVLAEDGIGLLTRLDDQGLLPTSGRPQHPS
jgi:phosphatidate phosphatase APP1